MSAFRVSAAGLLRLATDGTLADRIAEQVRMSGHGVSPSERTSWSAKPARSTAARGLRSVTENSQMPRKAIGTEKIAGEE